MIQKYVQDPLAEMIIAGKIKDGETVPVTAASDALIVGDYLFAERDKSAPLN